jgi:hypothetical protein
LRAVSRISLVGERPFMQSLEYPWLESVLSYNLSNILGWRVLAYSLSNILGWRVSLHTVSRIFLVGECPCLQSLEYSWLESVLAHSLSNILGW